MFGYIVNYNDRDISVTGNEEFKLNQHVLVEFSNGNTICLIKAAVVTINKPEGEILRLANQDELKNIELERTFLEDVKINCKKIASQLNLPMNVGNVSLDEKNNQLKISFYSDSRIDFRELAKKLGSKYKKRIEFRQIGARDKAKKIGGIGPCGLILCCSLYLQSFESISINMAKNQLLALNPSKINGQCGRLLCCLEYEDNVYSELKAKLPKLGQFIEYKEYKGKVIEVQILKSAYVILTEKGEKKIIQV